MAKVKVGRAISGISLNGLEWLLNEDGSDMQFEDKEKAKEFLREHDYPDATDEEMEDYYTFKEIE
jgi:hypothetical protein